MGGRKPGKIVPMLTNITGMLKSQNVISLHFARNTFKTNERLDELKRISESTQEVLTKARTEAEAKKNKYTKFRKFVNRAGDTTFLKVIGVSMAYYGICVGGCYYAYCGMEKVPQGAKLIEDVKGKWEHMIAESKKRWDSFGE